MENEKNNEEKEFYNLKELEFIVGIKNRQLSNRVKNLKQMKKYKNSKLLFKKSNIWHIHKSVIFEFARKRSKIDYKLFTTIAVKDNYPIKLWNLVSRQFNKEILETNDKYNRTKFVVERTQSGINHLHLMTTFNDQSAIKKIIKGIVYLMNLKLNIDITNIWEVKGLNEYLRKENHPTLIK